MPESSEKHFAPKGEERQRGGQEKTSEQIKKGGVGIGSKNKRN